MAIAGYNTIGGSTDVNAVDDGGVTGPFTVGASATITEFHIYLTVSGGSGGGSMRPLIYADNAGEPGALIATLAQITVSANGAAWRDITGLSVSVGAATAVWIGRWTNNNLLQYSFDTPGGNPGRYKSAFATYSAVGDAPTPWPAASDITSGQQVSEYVVYTPAAAAAASLAWIRA